MEPLFEPLLGPGYIMITQGVAAVHVPPGADGRALWSTSAPHRDRMGPDARTLAHDVPSILTLWLPLTDVTTEHSCIYVVPAAADPGFYSPEMTVGKFRLQDIRALPAAAGAVLSWSSHLIHWGSRSSSFVTTPRMAVTMYFQRRDVPLWHPFSLDPGRPCSFTERLTWIDHGMARPGLLGGVTIEGA
jgi:ectoine hydroxylase-related dioxygenase (phytanoyl-CoA dioxygenase family)